MGDPMVSQWSAVHSALMASCFDSRIAKSTGEECCDHTIRLPLSRLTRVLHGHAVELY